MQQLGNTRPLLPGSKPFWCGGTINKETYYEGLQIKYRKGVESNWLVLEELFTGVVGDGLSPKTALMWLSGGQGRAHSPEKTAAASKWVQALR